MKTAATENERKREKINLLLYYYIKLSVFTKRHIWFSKRPDQVVNAELEDRIAL